MNLAKSNIRSDVDPNFGSAIPYLRNNGEGYMPTIRQYLRIVVRWRVIIIAAVISSILAGLIATLLMTSKYTAISTIEIDRESDKVTTFQGVASDASIADQEFYQTQYSLLQSRSLSERVAGQLQLVDSPDFFNMFRVSGNNTALQVTNGHYPASGRFTRQRIAGEILLKHINIKPTRLSRLVDVSFTSPDKDFSARVVNAWTGNFIQTNLERKIQATSYGRDLLQQQLVQAKDKLDESQRQLVDYASEQKIITLPTSSGDGGTVTERPMLVDNLAALNTALSQATANRIAAQTAWQQQGRAGASPVALTNIAINNLREKRAEMMADYQRMMTQYEPGYPAVQSLKSQIDQLNRSISQEESRASGSLYDNYQQSLAQERALSDQVNKLKVNFLDLRLRSIQYNIYQQEVDTNRTLYDGLLQRLKEIGVAGGVGVNNVSVVDPAEVPAKPSSPILWLNLVIALLAGLVLGTGLAFVLEQMDEAITDPAEVERLLGLPLLGLVPKLEQGTPIEALSDRKSDLVDAYLAIQTNLGFATEHGIPRSLVVTSTRPAEGKSTSALALATMLTRAQRKVILVDGDMRSPSVHHFAGMKNDYGLSNFLAGQDEITALIFPMADFGFSAMAAGPLPPNAAELLTGNRLPILIERLLENFDHVVIDSPPVMGLADAPLLASRVEGVVYTIESHGTRSSLVKTAIGRLVSANAHILGGILTKFEAQKSYYGYSYGYEYGYGYGRGKDAQVKAARGG